MLIIGKSLVSNTAVMHGDFQLLYLTPAQIPPALIATQQHCL